MIFIKLLFSAFPFVFALWFATQKLASLCQYDPLLGRPYIMLSDSPVYLPYPHDPSFLLR